MRQIILREPKTELNKESPGAKNTVVTAYCLTPLFLGGLVYVRPASTGDIGVDDKPIANNTSSIMACSPVEDGVPGIVISVSNDRNVVVAIDGTVIVKQPDADDPANPYGIWLEPTGDNGAPKLTMTTTPWRVIRIVKHGLNPDGTVSCSAVVSIGASGVAGKALKLVTVTEAPTAATRTVRENYMLPTPRIEETPNWGLLSTGIAAVVKLGDSPISPS